MNIERDDYTIFIDDLALHSTSKVECDSYEMFKTMEHIIKKGLVNYPHQVNLEFYHNGDRM